MKVINHDMPEPYKYETDYRKIPREYLNPRIPHGRGMIKWAPFATMPQQYEEINQHIRDQDKIEKPELSESALDDLNNVLAEKIFYNPQALIKYWEDGYFKEIACEINKFDSEHKKLEVIAEDKKVRLSMDCIVSIE
ncbi:YolD-like family protein [Mammaliicoccus lentus]|uniref:YolD-like family protein n=1 Tax=Mammaliicoccus lentus TaxID=42858 RepID=A0ABS6GTF1_MAMLE|nr:YolD-like family protein [Mammaliicoccus lentus]MBU6112571.1 YolD-like family protein [Mammaliicoccus lentus]